MNDLFCVLARTAPITDRTLAFLAAELGVDPAAAAEAAGKSPGFLLENTSLEKASAFNLRASAFGLETLLLSQEDLKRPPEATRVSGIELRPAGFYYVAGAAKEYLPFESVRAAAACAFSVELPPPDPGAGLKDSLTGMMASLQARYLPGLQLPESLYPTPADKRPKAAPPRETFFSADILAGELRLALACEEQDYSGLGGLKTMSTFENFRILLSEIAGLAGKAARNPFLDAFLKKEALGRLRHRSRDAYEKELLWLSTVAGDGRQLRP